MIAGSPEEVWTRFLREWRKSPAGIEAALHGVDPTALAAGGDLAGAVIMAMNLERSSGLWAWMHAELMGPKSARSPEWRPWTLSPRRCGHGLPGSASSWRRWRRPGVELADGGGESGMGDGDYSPSGVDLYSWNSPGGLAPGRRKVADRPRSTTGAVVHVASRGIRPGKALQVASGAHWRRAKAKARSARTSAKAWCWYTRGG